MTRDAAEVIHTLATITREVQTRHDRWYLLRLHPYRTLEDRIDGVVLTFVDITERRRDEEERRQAEAQQRAILDSARQSIMLIAPDYTLLRFNRYAAEAAVAVFGVEMQSGQSFLQYVTPDDHDDFIAHFGQALAGAEISIEKQIQGIAGSDWWEFFYYPIRLATGEVTGVTFTSRNIGERKRAEEALRESEEKFRTLSDTAPALIWYNDQNGENRFINQHFLDFTGMTAEEIHGTGWHTLVHPDERPGGLTGVVGKSIQEVLPNLEQHWKDVYAQVAKTGEPVRLVNYAQDVDRWFDTYLTMLAGSDKYVAVVFNDITERKRRERQQAFLLKLSDTLRAEPNADAVAHRALRMLFEQMSLDRCYIGVYRPEEDRVDLTHQVGNDRVPPLPDGVCLSDFPEALRVASDRTLVIDDVAETAGLSDADRRNIGTLGLRALVAASLRKGDNTPLWTIVAVSASPRRWTQGEITF